MKESHSWKNIRVEDLGYLYESLLERNPQIDIDSGCFLLSSLAGNKRKTTGSYYTPKSMVECVLQSTLEPVLERATRKKNPAQH